MNGELILGGFIFLGIGGSLFYFGWRMKKGGAENLDPMGKANLWLYEKQYGPERREQLFLLITGRTCMENQGIFKMILGIMAFFMGVAVLAQGFIG